MGDEEGRKERETYHRPGSCVLGELYIPYRSERSRGRGTNFTPSFLRMGKELAFWRYPNAKQACMRLHNFFPRAFCVCPLVKIQSSRFTYLSPSIHLPVHACVRACGILTSPLPSSHAPAVQNRLSMHLPRQTVQVIQAQYMHSKKTRQKLTRLSCMQNTHLHISPENPGTEARDWGENPHMTGPPFVGRVLFARGYPIHFCCGLWGVVFLGLVQIRLT